MSYAGIPIIYTISDNIIPEGARFIEEYYNNLAFSNLTVPSNKQPTFEAFKVSSSVKPQLALLTFENIIGVNKFKENFVSYSNEFIFKQPTSKDFRAKMLAGVAEIDCAIYDENICYR